MNVEKVKAIAHNLKLLAISLEDAIKEDVEAFRPPEPASRLGYRYDDDDDGYADCNLRVLKRKDVTFRSG